MCMFPGSKFQEDVAVNNHLCQISLSSPLRHGHVQVIYLGVTCLRANLGGILS